MSDKPKIWKLRGRDQWRCVWLQVSNRFGDGPTPAAAFEIWVRKVPYPVRSCLGQA